MNSLRTVHGLDDVHVWRVPLNPESLPANLPDLLSDEEHARAATFRFEAQRREFVITRSALRQILAAYTGQPASEIQFRYGVNGKPELKGNTLHFNVSHSNVMALIAIGRTQLGIDVERLVRDFAWEDLAPRVLSSADQQWLRSLPSVRQREAFFHCWTRREAYAKAVGEGITREPPRCGVSLSDVLVGETSVWSIRSFRPLPDYVAACAKSGAHCQFYSFNFEPQDVWCVAVPPVAEFRPCPIVKQAN